MRDMHPESEIAIWSSIAAAWLDYHEAFVSDEELSNEEEKKLLAALINISGGVTDPQRLGVPVEVGKRLLRCYDGLSKE